MSYELEISVPEDADFDERVLDIDIYRLRSRHLDLLMPGDDDDDEKIVKPAQMAEVIAACAPDGIEADDVPLVLIAPIFSEISEQVFAAFGSKKKEPEPLTNGTAPQSSLQPVARQQVNS